MMMVLRRVSSVVAVNPVVVPPSWTPGRCYHQAHVIVDGKRLGLLLLDDDLASVLPCEHIGEDGRS